MRPGFWIAILTLLGAIVGYAVWHATGWLGAGIGGSAGFVVGLAVHSIHTRKAG